MTDNYISQIQHKQTFTIQPHELYDIPKTIQQKIMNTIGTCSKTHGYITNVSDIRIANRKHNISRTNGDIYVAAQYTIETIKPEPHHEYNALVNTIIPQGILCEYKNIQIIVSPNKEEWMYDNNTFQSGKKTIQQGDWIRVHIDAVQYSNANYQCIAHMV